MNTIAVDSLGHKHEIRACTLDDIEPHFEKVADIVGQAKADEYKDRMRQAVEAGTAYALTDDSCFFYYIKYNKWGAHGVAVYGKYAPIRLLALGAGIFRFLDKDTFKIDFALHEGKFVEEYKSLLTLSSMKRHTERKDPLVLRIDHLLAKVNRLDEQRGIRWDINSG